MPPAEIYIELVVNFAEDPKVRSLLRYGADARGLRDLYIQMALYAKRNLSDGFVPEEEIGILVYPDTWENGQRDADRLVTARLIERVENGYIVAAYAKRNRTKAEVLKRTEEKSAGGALGNHRRWHKGGVVKADCRYCRSDTDRSTDRTRESGTESPHPADAAVAAPMRRDEAHLEGPQSAAEVNLAEQAETDRGSDQPKSDRNDTDRSTDRYPTRGRSSETETETETETEEKNSPSPQGGARGSRRADSAQKFAEFWSIYPRKVGKPEALKAWNKAIKAGTDPDDVITGANAYLRDPIRRNAEIKFTAHPSTWLNQGRWTDEATPVQNASGGGWWNN